MRTNVTVALVAALMLAGSAFAQATEPDKASPTTATTAVNVPEQDISDMVSLVVKRPSGSTRDEQMKALTENMEKVITLGAAAEKKYPAASNLSQVHRIMLQAADFLAKTKKDAASQKQLDDLVTRILKSNADVEAKVTADFVRTMHHVMPAEGNPANDAPKQLQAFVDRYKDGKGAGSAYAFAAQLAQRLGLSDVHDKYVKILKDEYKDNPSVRNYLRHLGEYNDVGQPFTATLTKLDGTKLNLPADLKGKVVVVDFWASWCPPCRESIPEVVALYKKYKDKGVEVVAISLDNKKEDAQDYAKANDMTYIQTYDGGQSETAMNYGIEGIPTVFVIGKDGKIFSTTAREDLEGTVEKALKAGTATTSTKSAAK